MAAAAAVVAITASFLPWYRDSGFYGYEETSNGWLTPHEAPSIAAAAVCVSAALFVVAFAALVPSGDREARRFGVAGGLAGIFGGAIAALLVWDKYQQPLSGVYGGYQRQYGFSVAAMASALVLLAGILVWRDRGRTGTSRS